MSATASPEPRTVRRTLRGRVSLLGLCVIAAWVLVLTVGFAWTMRARLHSERDTVLRNRVMSAAATVLVSDGGTVTVREPTGDEALDSGIWVFAGRRAVERPGGGEEIQGVADSLAGQGARYGSSDNYRLYAEPIRHDGRQIATVVGSSSDTPYEHALTESLEGSTVVGLLVLLGAYPVLRFAAGRALRPVDAMTRQAGDWSVNALTERFGPDQRFREVQSLANTLDAVLDRLAAVVRHERRLPAELSHELRTPLSRIMAETDLLMAHAESDAQSRAALLAIRDGAASMNQILETLLDAARADVTATPGRCDLRPLVESIIAAYTEPVQHARPDEHVAPGENVGPDEHAEPDERGQRPSVRSRVGTDLAVGVDAAIVERVLTPILDNARRYARAEIVVVAQRSSDSVLIDVMDDGPGVPVELREAIFEPGRRGNPDDGHRGAGLGLALSRRLARSVASDVTVVGPDSRFRIRLPPA